MHDDHVVKLIILDLVIGLVIIAATFIVLLFFYSESLTHACYINRSI